MPKYIANVGITYTVPAADEEAANDLVRQWVAKEWGPDFAISAWYDIEKE